MDMKPHKNLSQKKKNKNSKPILLTISLLVSNRIDTIRKCMESIKPILEAVPSELIVVDTGGTDGSIDVVREYTKKIVPFVWCDDFSAARNAGLMQAKGEWFLFLDDDEWFEDVTEIIDFFRSDDHLKYASLGYFIRNYKDYEGKEYGEAFLCRGMRLIDNVKFHSPIHEYPEPIYEPMKKFQCFVHHYSYVFADPKEKRKHFERNIAPLLKILKENPNDIRFQMQMMQEYESVEEYDKIIEICEYAMDMEEQYKLPRFIDCIYFNYIRTLIMKQDLFEEGIQKGNYILENCNPNQLASVGMLEYMFIGYRLLDKPEGVVECAKKIWELNDFLQKNQKILFSQYITDMHTVLEKKKLAEVYTFGMASSCNLEQADDCCFFVKEILKLESSVSDELRHSLEKAKRMLGQEKIKLIQCLAECETDDIYILIQKMLLAENKGETEKISQLIQYSISKIKKCLPPNEFIFIIALRNGQDMTPLLNPLDEDEWHMVVKSLIAKATEEEQKEYYSLIPNTLAEVDKQKADYFFSVLSERMILTNQIEEKNLIEIIKKYCEAVVCYTKFLYKERFFLEEMELKFLPKSCQFALKMKYAFPFYERKQYHEFSNLLKEAVKIYPTMAEPIKLILDIVQKEVEKGHGTPAEQEFYLLKERVKKEIVKLIEEGKRQEAAEVIAKMRVLVCDDTELDELEKQIVS